MLKFPYYGLVAEFVVVEGLGEEMITLGLEVQKILRQDKETAYKPPSILTQTHKTRSPGFGQQGSGPLSLVKTEVGPAASNMNSCSHTSTSDRPGPDRAADTYAPNLETKPRKALQVLHFLLGSM